jgi:hypothetical protein
LLCVVLFISPAYSADSTSLLRETAIPIASFFEKVRTASGESLWVCPEIAEEKLTVLIDPKDAGKVRQALDLLPGYQWVSGTLPDGSAER